MFVLSGRRFVSLVSLPLSVTTALSRGIHDDSSTRRVTIPCSLNLTCFIYKSICSSMSLNCRRPSKGEKQSNFFFLSDLTPWELCLSFFKPITLKSGLGGTFFVGHKHSEAPQPRLDMENGNKAESVNERNSTSPSVPKSPSSTLFSAEKGSSPPEQDQEQRQTQEEEESWKPGNKEWLIMITLAIASLTVALDATILVAVLPVCVKALLLLELANPFRLWPKLSTAKQTKHCGLALPTFSLQPSFNPSLPLSAIFLVVASCSFPVYSCL
jgi:hypothetical protein